MVAPAMPEMAPVAAPAAQEAPVIYGGANPATDINLNTETNHQIYGGADPLQNTQTIPTVAPVAAEVPVVEAPVMTAMPEVAPVAPAVPEMVAPAAPVMQAPEMVAPVAAPVMEVPQMVAPAPEVPVQQ